ncbi:MAG: hypothetical protein H6R15_4087 [Proteobacteria bacterium]|nr:hypothetical protein [Pseudomonadota bacterium]
MPIKAPPLKAPYPAPEFLQHAASSPEDLLNLCGNATDLPCRIPVMVGLYFDGTNNHMERDRKGKRVPVPLDEDELKAARAVARREGRDPTTVEPPPIADRPMTPELCSHTNVARLFQTFPRDKQAKGYHPFYIQGVGTPFPKIGEPTESSEGKAFAKGGLPRIVWGIFQVMNAVHITLTGGKALYDDDEVGQLAVQNSREVGQPKWDDEKRQPIPHEEWFAPHIAKLKTALEAKPKPSIPSLTISVFGFSRGAAEAATFCQIFDRLLDGGKLAGIATEIQFLGLFDLVASVGGSASVARTMPLPDALFDGHWDWANEVLKPLPGSVRKCLHLIATHELRMNFPVTQIEGSDEIYVPGSHSNVGGGYGPGEQGKSRGSQAALLSQIPLAFMYQAAREAGVPLLPFSELEPTDQDDFLVDSKLAQGWEAYTAALDGDGHLLKKHMELFYRWRAACLDTLENTDSFKAASAQNKEDLSSANKALAGDLEALRYRRDTPPALPGDQPQSSPYSSKDRNRMNQWHRTRAMARESLDSWERFALTFFDNPTPLPRAVEAFFDEYVHDSFATFYYAGAVTEYDKRAKVKEVMKKKPEQRNKFETKVADVTNRTEEAKRKREAGEALNADEIDLLKTAEGGTPYPIMTDAEADQMSSGKEKAVFLQTDSRREGGGHIIRRGYYPHTGFFIRRSKHEEQLEEAPNPRAMTPAQKKAAAANADAADENAPRELVWSDNLRVDTRLSQVEHA